MEANGNGQKGRSLPSLCGRMHNTPNGRMQSYPENCLISNSCLRIAGSSDRLEAGATPAGKNRNWCLILTMAPNASPVTRKSRTTITYSPDPRPCPEFDDRKACIRQPSVGSTRISVTDEQMPRFKFSMETARCHLPIKFGTVRPIFAGVSTWPERRHIRTISQYQP